MKKNLRMFHSLACFKACSSLLLIFVGLNLNAQTVLRVPGSLSGENGFGIENSRSTYTYASGDVIAYFNATVDGDGFAFASVNLSSSTSNLCTPAERRVQLNSFELTLNSTSVSKIVIEGNSSGAGARYLRALYVNNVLVIANGDDARIKSFHPGGSASENCDDITVEGLEVPQGAKIKIVIGGSATGTPQNFRVNTITLTPAGALPVRLLEFDALRNGNAVEVLWKAANETEGKTYHVQRSSNGNEFQTISTTAVSGAGSYKFIDNTPKQSRLVYYRLEMKSVDGITTYSKIRAVNMEGENQLMIAPNPVRGNTMLATFAPVTEPSTARIISPSGMILKNQPVPAFTNQATLSTDGMNQGVYMLQIISGKNIQTVRFIKQ